MVLGNEMDCKMIISAREGNKEAIEVIIEYFKPYMKSISYAPIYNAYGKEISRSYDEDLYMCLIERLWKCIHKTNGIYVELKKQV